MKFDDTNSLSHTTWECKYHIVFDSVNISRKNI